MQYTPEEKKRYLEQFKDFYESGKGSREKFAKENGLTPKTFREWVAESEKYGVEIEVHGRHIDEEKTAYLERYKEFRGSGKGGRRKFAKENGLAPSTFGRWVVKAEKRDVDLKFRNRRFNKRSKEKVRQILKAWMEDAERRALADFARAWTDSVITERTMQNWAQNASKYGLSQQAVDECRESRRKKRSERAYTYDEKKGYVDRFFGQSDSLETYARTEGVPRDTLKNWVKNAERYGWEQRRVDLALRNGQEAQERGLQDPLDFLPQLSPATGPAQFPAPFSHTDASQADPSQVAERVISLSLEDWEQYVDYGAFQGHSQQDEVTGFGWDSSAVAAHAAVSPQEFLPDSSSAPALDSDAYDQYLLPPGVASHHLSTGSGQSRDHSSRWGGWSNNLSGQGAGNQFRRS
ncbi:hypothetical protein ACFC09_45875 [Streptomyces sp. NPDC056161]|uniref:hypothetical protein n=1 Tax=Streptomyces sp. NPDC056161 TaxID=3345732 RepID=UPI0035DBAE10